MTAKITLAVILKFKGICEKAKKRDATPHHGYLLNVYSIFFMCRMADYLNINSINLVPFETLFA